MVGNSIITMDSIQRKDHNLEKVPAVSPLEGSIRFKLTVTSESQVIMGIKRIEQKWVIFMVGY